MLVSPVDSKLGPVHTHRAEGEQKDRTTYKIVFYAQKGIKACFEAVPCGLVAGALFSSKHSTF